MDRTGFARGEGEVIALRTHYPYDADPSSSSSSYSSSYSSGASAWDERVTRAFVVLRNPMASIPSHFDEMYAMAGHLPTSGGGGAAARDAWVRWRDDRLPDQLLLYESFVSYWMERHAGRDGERLYFSYEGLVDAGTGPGEVVRLARFLEAGVRSNAIVAMGPPPSSSSVGGSAVSATIAEEAEAVVATIPEEAEAVVATIAEEAEAVVASSFVDAREVPCVWEAVVRAAMPGRGAEDRRSSADRPFTAEDVAGISGMLSRLMERYSGHGRLRDILSEYRREVLSAPAMGN